MHLYMIYEKVKQTVLSCPKENGSLKVLVRFSKKPHVYRVPKGQNVIVRYLITAYLAKIESIAPLRHWHCTKRPGYIYLYNLLLW